MSELKKSIIEGLKLFGSLVAAVVIWGSIFTIGMILTLPFVILFYYIMDTVAGYFPIL